MTQPGSTSPDPSVPNRQQQQRVLDELERFQLAIRTIREKRHRVEGEFEPQPHPYSPAVAARPAAVALPPAADPAAVNGGLEPVRSLPGLTGAAIERPAAGERPQPLASTLPSVETPAPRRSSRPAIAAVAAIVALLALGAAWVIGRPTPPQQGVEQQPAATSPAPALPATKPAPPVDPHLLRVDLTTVRTVWLRVAVDGRIAIEREVAAGEQLPFGADRSIVVRAGDAGAVTVRVGGVEQGPLGRDGQVLTQSFAAPAR